MKDKKIAVFDSGVGALSVLKPLLKILPNEDFYYLGDSKRMPYGEKTPEQIERFTKNAFKYLDDLGSKAGVIACNTATCYALDGVNEDFDFPVLGVVGPGARTACSYTKNKKILLLATAATVNSKVYERYIKEIDKDLEVMAIACPKLVIAMENKHYADAEGKEIIREYLDQAKDFDYDTLILGCTHFPLARGLFDEILPGDINIVDPAIATAQELKELLEKDGLIDTDGRNDIKFYVTGDVDNFKTIASEILGLNLDELDVTKINID